MPSYLILAGWTQLGVEEIKDSPERLETARKVFRANGGELKEFYMVMGEYDMALIAEAPNDESMAKILLQINRAGRVRSQTMRLFTEKEYRKVIGDLP